MNQMSQQFPDEPDEDLDKYRDHFEREFGIWQVKDIGINEDPEENDYAAIWDTLDELVKGTLKG